MDLLQLLAICTLDMPPIGNNNHRKNPHDQIGYVSCVEMVPAWITVSSCSESWVVYLGKST